MNNTVDILVRLISYNKLTMEIQKGELNMLINNMEIKKGDCIIACATEPGGYHYMLGFAFKAEDIKDNKVVCTFHKISSDDFVVGYYPKQIEFEELYFPPAYDIYIVDEDAMNTFISQVQSENLDEDEVWEFFEQANKNAVKTIQKYRD